MPVPTPSEIATAQRNTLRREIERILEDIHSLNVEIEAKNDFVIAVELPGLDMTAGGLYIPVREQKYSHRAVVVAVGPGRFNATNGERIPMSAKVGDQIVFGDRIASYIEVHLRKLLVMRDHDIISTLREKVEPEAVIGVIPIEEPEAPPAAENTTPGKVRMPDMF